MKMKKTTYMSVLFVLFLFLSGICVSAAETGIYDDADLFQPEEELILQEHAETFKNSYDMNVVFVTTNDAQEKTSRAYADDFYMDQGYYENGAKGGILYLIDMDNREVYLSTSGDMIYYCTDERIDEIIDVGYELLGEQNYAGCMENMLSQTQHFMEAGIPRNQYTYDEETGKIVRHLSLTRFEIIIAFLVALAAAGITCGVIIGKYKLKWGGYEYPYKKKSRVNLNVKEDRFINQVVTSRTISDSSSSGGSGRSSVHTSSGGGTFGGGGRKF